MGAIIWYHPSSPPQSLISLSQLFSLQLPLSDPALDFLSVLKWALLCNTDRNLGDLNFDARDVYTLIHHHIPLELNINSPATERVVPYLLALEGPEGKK